MAVQTDSFAAWLQLHSARIEAALHEACGNSSLRDAPERLRHAVESALLSGGKRVRPGLALLACAAECRAVEPALPAAVAVELIHAYSLVHDDLPSMDDDVLRRGQPTIHAAYGEAMAVLAGDALQSIAYEVLAGQADAELARDQMRILSTAAGPAGMVGGQVLDLEAEGAPCELEDVERIHRTKTGALLGAALFLGARAGGGTASAWEPYARAVGGLFQATDDLLDTTASTRELGKTAGKDEASGKATLVAAAGLEGARARAEELALQARQAAVALPIRSCREELAEFPTYLLDRCR